MMSTSSLKSQTIVFLIVWVSLSALVFAVFKVVEVIRIMNSSPIFLESTFENWTLLYDEELDFGYLEQVPSLLDATPYLLQTAPKLLYELRKKRLQPPPPLANASKFVRHDKNDDKVFQLQRTILKILRGKTRGFFVDAGSTINDGISISNTFDLEMDLGWTGILIEPNPVYFQILMKQRRKVWTINACLGTEDVSENSSNLSKTSSINPIFNIFDAPNNTKTTAECFSLVSIIAAVGQHLLMNVDYLSLNIEMARVDILQNILWDHVYFKIISLEATLGQVKPLLNLMTVNKYTFVCQFNSTSSSNHVYLFVHKKHRYNRELANNGFRRWGKNVTKKMRVKEKHKDIILHRSQNK